MSTNNSEFEVVYTPLQAPGTIAEGTIAATRAVTAMVSSRFVRGAQQPVFFNRTANGAGFSIRSARPEALASLPLSYGSVAGHFGVFERSAVRSVSQSKQFRVVYTIGSQFASYSECLQRRLSRQVGARLKEYAAACFPLVDVRALPSTCAIVVSGDSVHALECLPNRFNAVFQRSGVMEVFAS